ncbi:hypothetical protein [Streptomyces sp. NWU339]|uniref:DUF6927 domain-containing protein n=1 Tax=Streptomyces sp. NWU339 TaxID=2185284 RepID=UPI0026BDA18C
MPMERASPGLLASSGPNGVGGDLDNGRGADLPATTLPDCSSRSRGNGPAKAKDAASQATSSLVRKHLKPGTRLRLIRPLRFSDDTERDTFTYTRTGGRRQGRLTHGSALSRCWVCRYLTVCRGVVGPGAGPGLRPRQTGRRRR